MIRNKCLKIKCHYFTYFTIIFSLVNEALDLTIRVYNADLLEFNIYKLGCLGVKIGVQVIDVLHVDLLPLLYDVLLNQVLFPWKFRPVQTFFIWTARGISTWCHIILRLTKSKENITNAAKEARSSRGRTARSWTTRRHILDYALFLLFFFFILLHFALALTLLILLIFLFVLLLCFFVILIVVFV